MITLRDSYNVLANVVPLYVALILGYASVKWLKMFNSEQCSGISKFVSKFAVPLLSYNFISTNNPYTMNFRFIAADTLQKIIVMVILGLWAMFSSKGSLQWFITLFSISTLPSILVMGVPMLDVMYGHVSDTLLVQTVVLQYLIWFTLLLVLLEYRAARVLISENVPKSSGLISSVEVDGDITSLDGDKEGLETQTEDLEGGKLHVKVSRKSSASSSRPVEMGDCVSGGFSTQMMAEASKGGGKDRRMFVRCLSAPSSFPNGLADSTDPGNRLVGEGTKPSASSTAELQHESVHQSESKHTVMPPASVMTKLILMMVWRKLIRNPNTYASLIGLAWSLISFRLNIEMPTIVSGSTKILSDGALGMAMFSLGLFIALQPKFIACGKAAAAFAALAKFVVGPVIMAAASLAVGLKGTLLHVAIVQAALPLGIVTFVFAKEYDVHPDIQSTGVIFGMLIALPITLIYYILLGL